MSKIIKNTSIYTIGNILPKATSILLLPLYTKYLSPEDYGIVNSMTVLLTILAIFFSMSIERSIYRLYYDYSTEEDKKNYLGTIFFTIILNAIGVLLVILVGKSIIAKAYSSIPFYPYYVYIISTGFLSVFGIIPKIYLQVEQKALKFILLSLFEFTISTLLTIYFVVFLKMGASGPLLAGLVNSILFLPLFILIVLKVINFTFKYEIMKEGLIYSFPLVPMILSAWILNLSDRIFIERFKTLWDVGIYSLAYKMAEILLFFTAAFDKAYDPIFYKSANQANQIEAKKMLYKYNKAYSIILIIGALGICLFAKEFILLLDAKYNSAISLVPIIMIGLLFAQIGGLFNRSIYQVKRTKLIMNLSIGVACMNIFLNWLLIPNFGSYGAAYATSISFMIFFLLKYHYTKKCYYIEFAWKELSLYLIISVAIISLFIFLNFSFWFAILTKTAVMICFISFIAYLNRESVTKILHL